MKESFFDTNFGSVIHRADYHEIMLEEAKRLGVEIRLDCNVESLDFDRTEVVVTGGERLKADVIIGADGSSAPNHASSLPVLPCLTPHDQISRPMVGYA